MKHTKADPTPKPDHIRSLRDLAANFVRAIDTTSLEFETVATTDLTERVACLTALHEMEGTDLAKMATKDLRSRVVALQQARKHQDNNWELRSMSNGELKKRIDYLRQFNEVKNLDNLEGLDQLADDVLVTVSDTVEKILRVRRKAKAKAEAEARQARVRALSADHLRFVRAAAEEEDAESEVA